MPTVYLGTSDFAAAVLERLARSRHRPSLVVTRPDRQRGRGRRLASPPAADTARALDIDVIQPESVNDDDARRRIADERPEAVCVCAFGGLLKEPLLSEHEVLNVHPSLLPRWRGAAPVERAIMAGDDKTGVSMMRLTEGLDAGPVCLQSAVPIHPDDTYGSLASRLQDVSGELLIEALSGPRRFAEQDEGRATYAEKIGPEDRVLDPGRFAQELEWVVRALTPHIGARAELPGGMVVGVCDAAALAHGPPQGEVAVQDERLLLGCASGALELRVVKPPGGRPMPAADFLRGHALAG